MDCEEFLEGYSDFLDGQFERAALSDYRYHLWSCRRCAEYDRVVRCGLRLVRELEPPRPSCDVLPLPAPPPRGSHYGRYSELGRTPVVAGVAAVCLAAIVSLPLLLGGRAVELPPVVVDKPGDSAALPLLWGPPPTFAPTASFLRVAGSASEQLWLSASRPFSLFRTRPGTAGSSDAGEEPSAEAPE